MCNKPAYLISFVIVLIVAHSAPAGLVGHWTFDEDSGAVAADSSGKGNTGTVTGDAAWVAGQMGGSALNFDDSDDIVIIPDAPSLDIEDALTISLWVNTSEVVSPNHMVRSSRVARRPTTTRAIMNSGSRITPYSSYTRHRKVRTTRSTFPHLKSRPESGTTQQSP